VAIFLVQLAVNVLAAWWNRARLPALHVRAYLLRAVLALAPMVVAVLVLEPALYIPVRFGRVWNLGLPVTVLAGAAAYGAALVALGAVTRDDWRTLRTALGR
jgi:hypothetical protein